MRSHSVSLLRKFLRRGLSSALGALAVATGCFAAGQPTPATALAAEYSSEYSYRLAYTVANAPAPAPESVAPPSPTPRAQSLADHVSYFLSHPASVPTPQPVNLARPLMSLTEEPAEEEVTERWMRFTAPQFNDKGVQKDAAIRAESVPGARGSPDQCNVPLQPAQSVADAWDRAYTIVAIYGRCPNATVLLQEPDGRGRDLAVVEPRIPTEITATEAKFELVPVEGSSRAWPFPNVVPDRKKNEIAGEFWHRWPQFTGLDAALDRLERQVPGLEKDTATRVRVAHLDTGYPDMSATQFKTYPLPRNFRADLSSDCYEVVRTGGNGPCQAGGVDISNTDPTFNNTSWFLTNYLHGAGTLSILAGGFVDASHPRCAPASVAHWGANPCAEVFEVRVGQSFVHFNEESLALGITDAVDKQADVISLSHGGMPAAVLASAVDYAYRRGTPIFSASGDFLGTFLLSTPKTVVFPARYTQVMDVTGVTAAGRSAGQHCALLFCIWHFGGGNGFWSNFKDWLVGTNFGPSQVMAGHSIAAYTPNITFYDTETGQPGLSNDELGTSAAVPQAAGAASIWLEYHRHEIIADGAAHPVKSHVNSDGSEDTWRSWRKTEAVYQAMLKSARPASGMSEDAGRQYAAAYFGAGSLNADAMLDQAYIRPTPCERRARSRADLFWWADVLGSMTVFDALNWSPATESESHKVETAFANSVRTELQQLAYRSPKLAGLLSEISRALTPDGDTACRNTNNDFSKVSRAQWERLNSLVRSDPFASQTMKRVVSGVVARQRS